MSKDAGAVLTAAAATATGGDTPQGQPEGEAAAVDGDGKAETGEVKPQDQTEGGTVEGDKKKGEEDGF